MTPCPYIKGSNVPCDECPRLITAIHRCGLLQEGARELRPDATDNHFPTLLRSRLTMLAEGMGYNSSKVILEELTCLERLYAEMHEDKPATIRQTLDEIKSKLEGLEKAIYGDFK